MRIRPIVRDKIVSSRRRGDVDYGNKSDVYHDGADPLHWLDLEDDMVRIDSPFFLQAYSQLPSLSVQVSK